MPVITSLDRDAKLTAYNLAGEHWKRTDFGTLGHPNTSKKPLLGQDFFVHNTLPGKAHVWNGTEWKDQIGSHRFRNGGMTIAPPHLAVESRDGALTFYRKLQNEIFSPVHAFVVTERRVEDPVRGREARFAYEYDPVSARFDFGAYSAKFHQVTLKLPDHGKKILLFHNGGEFDDAPVEEGDDPRELSGNLYLEKEFDAGNRQVAETKRHFRVFRKPDLWPQGARQIQLVKSESTRRGTATETIFQYHEGNGLVARTEEKLPDSRKRTTTLQFAYEVSARHDGMEALHMLSQVAGRRVYEGTPAAGQVEQAEAMVWSNGLNGNWHADSLWSWSGSGGAPTDFDYENTDENDALWKLRQGVTARDAFGRVVEETSPSGTPSCIRYGLKDISLMARIDGAACAEADALTGDFDNGSGAYLDAPGGWLRNQAVLDPNPGRFGGASLRLGAGHLGPEKSLPGTRADTDYEFSTWISPVGGSSGAVALVVENATGQEILPGEAEFAVPPAGPAAGWLHISRKLPADLVGDQAVTLRIESRGGAELLFQDLRFYPSGSQVMTRYEHSRLFQPLARASAAGAGEHFEYDQAGRLLKTYGEEASGARSLRQEFEYHLDGCAYTGSPSDKLALIKISAGHLPFNPDTRNYGDIWVDGLAKNVLLEFEAVSAHGEVQIRLDDGAWNRPCCLGNNAFEVELGDAPVKVEIRVGAGEPYVMVFKRPQICWTSAGELQPSGSGEAPAAAAGGEKWAAFADEADGGRLHVKKWVPSTGSWISVGGAVSAERISHVQLQLGSDGTPYAAFVDQVPVELEDGSFADQPRAVVKYWDGASWQPLAGDGSVSLGPVYDLEFKVQGEDLWLAFVGEQGYEEGLEAGGAVYVRQWTDGSWQPVGDWIPVPDIPVEGEAYQGDGIADGKVFDGKARGVALAVAPDGTPYVGYLGTVRYVEEENGELKAKGTPVFPIMKKLISPSSGADYWGGLVPDENGFFSIRGDLLPWPLAGDLELAFLGDDLHMAVDYEYFAEAETGSDELLTSGRRILEVRRFDPASVFADGTHWFPTRPGTVPDEYAVAFLEPGDHFRFLSAGTSLHLAYAGSRSHDRLTVIRRDGSGWKSVGNPAFFPVDASADGPGFDLALSPSEEPLLVVRSEDPRNTQQRHAAAALEFAGSCPDLTLANLQVEFGGVPQLPANRFRSYFLFPEAVVPADAEVVELALSPSALGELSAIHIQSPDGNVQSWNSGDPFPDHFNVSIGEGAGVVEIELVSSDGKSRNRYQLSLDRHAPSTIAGGINFGQFPIAPVFDLDNPGPYKIVVPEEVQSLTPVFDLSDVASVFVNGVPVEPSGSWVITLAPGTNVIVITIVDLNGNQRDFTVGVERGTPSLPVVPILTAVDQHPGGTFTARFGYSNPNAGERLVPVGLGNRMRYQGQDGLDLGQPTRFAPGQVGEAFSVPFDGSPLVWELEGRTVTATAFNAVSLMRVEMKDNGLSEENISKPQLRLVNESDASISGFKVSLWLSREEVPYQVIVADPYYFDPSGVTLAVIENTDNENLIRVDLQYPAGFTLAPGEATHVDGAQLGLHFQNYYPGKWDRTNDWSWQGIGPTYSVTPYVTVYGADGALLGGTEPDPAAMPQPPALTQAAVLSLDNLWAWEATGAGLELSASRRTEGNAALLLNGSGYFQVANLPMKTGDISGETQRLLVDFYLPGDQPDPYWMGAVQLIAHCPSVGLNDAYVGQVDLTGLPTASFSTLEFTVPASVLSVLQGDFRDFQFRWTLNINATPEKPVIDNMRFAP